MNYIHSKTAARFWSKIDKSGDCWIYGGAKNRKGYGVFCAKAEYDNTAMGAHRYAWIEHHGPIPDGLMVLHRCDNPPCVRAECNAPGCQHLKDSEECESHLFLGTARDNILDALAKGRITHNIANLRSFRETPLLSPSQKLEIISMEKAGIPKVRIAQTFGVSRDVIYNVQHRHKKSPKP